MRKDGGCWDPRTSYLSCDRMDISVSGVWSAIRLTWIRTRGRTVFRRLVKRNGAQWRVDAGGCDHELRSGCRDLRGGLVETRRAGHTFIKLKTTRLVSCWLRRWRQHAIQAEVHRLRGVMI